MDEFLEKKCMTFETCLVYMLYVDYGFTNNNPTFFEEAFTFY